MNLLFSCIGRRTYMVDYFRPHLAKTDKIIGTSNSRWAIGFKACDLGVIMPDIKSPEYIPSLIGLCRQMEVKGLLSFFDPDVIRLAPHTDQLAAAGVGAVIPSEKVCEVSFDKYKTFLFLKERGFNTPITHLDLGDALRDISAQRLKFPLIVKPRCGFASQHIYRARDEDELRVFHRCAPGMIIQELISGEDYDFDICNNWKGEVLAVVPWRKLASRAGEVDRAVTCKNDELMELGVRLGAAVGHVGPMDVDLIKRDGRIYIIELNTRFGGGYPMSHAAGADFPRLIMSLLRGENPKPEVGNFQSDIIMMKDYLIHGGRPETFFGQLLDYRGSQCNPTICEPTATRGDMQ